MELNTDKCPTCGKESTTILIDKKEQSYREFIEKIHNSRLEEDAKWREKSVESTSRLLEHAERQTEALECTANSLKLLSRKLFNGDYLGQ